MLEKTLILKADTFLDNDTSPVFFRLNTGYWILEIQFCTGQWSDFKNVVFDQPRAVVMGAKWWQALLASVLW